MDLKETLKCHFQATDKLTDMLADKRMTGKYGLRAGKYSRVLYANMFVWSVEPNFVALLHKKYGDVTFREAIKKYEEENEKNL